MAFRSTLWFFLFAVLFGCSDNVEWQKDYLERSVTVDGKTYKYRVRLPKNRDPNAKIPVMLYLHGSGSRGDDNITQVDNFRWAIEPLKEKIDFAVVLPQCKADTFWAAQDMANYALAALDETVKEFGGDPERLYLAGFSLGGYGTWQIAAANPGKFAALMPVAGGVVGERPIDPEDRAAIIPAVGEMLDSPDPYKAVASALRRTPVWVFHGSADDAVPVEFSRTIIKALKDGGNDNVRYAEYEGDKHQIFGKAITEPGFLEWLAEQRLNEGK